MTAGSTYTPIATTTLSSSANSYTFTSIPTTYTDLVLVINGSTTTSSQFRIQVGNGSIDTATNYSDTQIYATGSTVGTGAETNSANPYLCSTSTTNSTHIVQFMNYSNTTTFKPFIAKGGDLGQSIYDFSIILWRSTSAINTIKLSGYTTDLIASGTTLTLYGITAA